MTVDSGHKNSLRENRKLFMLSVFFAKAEEFETIGSILSHTFSIGQVY